jgi:hypothetical protein
LPPQDVKDAQRKRLTQEIERSQNYRNPYAE